MRPIIALGVLLPAVFSGIVFSGGDAQACWRCGNYSRCSYAVAKPVYVAPVQSVVNTYVVQNAYPSTIGQGATGYVSNGGYQASVLPLFDPNTYLAGVLEVQKAGQSGLALSMTRADALAQGFATLQAPAVERLAAGQAAEMVLSAAGLSTVGTNSAKSNAVLINRDAQGRVQILQLDQNQIAQVNQQAGQQPQQQNSLLGQFCGKCHGTQLAEAKGGLYLGDDPAVAATMRTKFFDLTKQVSSGKMPPAGEPQPTQEEKAGIFDELSAIINKYERK